MCILEFGTEQEWDDRVQEYDGRVLELGGRVLELGGMQGCDDKVLG